MYRAEHKRAYGARFETLARLTGDALGFDLGKYPPAVVFPLLDLVSCCSDQFDVAATQRVVEACSVRETMFLRHSTQLAVLRDALEEELVERTSGSLCVWSAGCATGEEAYSLAVTLAPLADAIDVLGTDVDECAIEHARRASYSLWSLRGVSPADVSSWLSIEGPSVRVREPMRKRVRFETHNLASESCPYSEPVDVIVCRNVLMYFRAEVAEVVLERFITYLRPGGILVLGPFDPQPSSGKLRVVGDGSMCVYRRAENEAVDSVEGCEEKPVKLGAVPRICVQAASLEAPRPSSPTSDLLDEGLTRARHQWKQGSLLEALEVVDLLIEQVPTEVSPHVLGAMIADELSLTDVALMRARAACFLAPEEIVPQYLLGICLEASGDPVRGLEALGRAREKLVRHAREFLPYGEGLTPSQLMRMTDVRLARRS